MAKRKSSSKKILRRKPKQPARPRTPTDHSAPAVRAPARGSCTPLPVDGKRVYDIQHAGTDAHQVMRIRELERIPGRSPTVVP